MRRFLMIAGLVLTLSNIGLGIAYACSCTDPFGGCTATGQGASCSHDSNGMCHCTDGGGPGPILPEEY